jgi:hypothetical protein
MARLMETTATGALVYWTEFAMEIEKVACLESRTVGRLVGNSADEKG